MATKRQNHSADTGRAPKLGDLQRALGLAAAAIERYSETPFENDAVRLFERLEEEIQTVSHRSAVRARARAVLDGRSPVASVR